MEEDQELMFVCKLCFKKYPCGKSLGGHMRSHLLSNVAESDEKLDPTMKTYSTFVVEGAKIGDLGNGQSVYGLRENPRKSWRAVDSNFPLPQEKICKQCGKKFHSLKALCGHMACHSEKDRGLKDDHSWTSDSQKLVNDSHSDTEADDQIVRTRSYKSKKFSKILVRSPSIEIDGEEQEELALCLMMLSRDSSFKFGVNSVVESSDNNSVILETKSSSIDTRPQKKDTDNKAYNLDETPKMKKIRDVNLKDSAFDAEIAEMENSDSGYFLDECAKAESDVSVDGFRRKKNEYDYGIDRPRKRRYSSELYNDYETIKQKDPNTSQKRHKYECFNCKKSFKSYQALGGHRPCHKKSNALYESRYESGDDSLEFVARAKLVESKKRKAKKSKGHVCPFCNRIFKNGQALGGHKRSHFIGGHEVNNNPSPVLKLDLLDLNLPAPQDDGNDRYSH